MGTFAVKHGFEFVPVGTENPVVQAFFKIHLKEHGYPLDISPAGTAWMAVVRKGGVYCVYGWHTLPDGSVNISDLYSYPSRWGTLAVYAALERIKEDADRFGVTLVTPTPLKNEAMMRAYRRIFGVQEPYLVVYRYAPKAVEFQAEARA